MTDTEKLIERVRTAARSNRCRRLHSPIPQKHKAPE